MILKQAIEERGGKEYMFSELIENITNLDVFTESIKQYISGLSINSVIITIMMIFMVIGAIDRIRGNKLG